MIIRVDSIPATGRQVELEDKGAGLGDAFKDSGYRLRGPVRASLDFTLIKGGVRVRGRVRALFTARCGRCLGEFSLSVDTPLDLFFSRPEGLGPDRHGGEVELRALDMDISVLGGDELDTRDILMAQIAEELPLSAVCSTDCKGLCHLCGADLNKGPCGCVVEEKVDARLAALKGFKVKARK